MNKSSRSAQLKALTVKSDKGNGKSLIALWDEWIKTLDISDNVKNNHYLWTRKIIPKDVAWDDIAWFKNYCSKVSPRTYKDRLSLIRKCISFHLSQGNIAIRFQI